MSVRGLKKHFPVTGGLLRRVVASVKAVDGVSFDLFRGETLGLVGESGCGKSTTGKTIIRLLEPTAGQVTFDGKDLFALPHREMNAMRRELAMIFQDPFSSLNPRKLIRDIVGEGFEIHEPRMPRGERQERVAELLSVVGLDPEYISRYPHEFSGGQRQRIGIARALALRPKLIIADEPVSALDVSIQSQILNLLEDLQGEFGLTYIFIAHNLSVVKHLSDRVGVMYLGKLVELCDGEQLYRSPLHPYTRALLSAIPIAVPRARKERIILEGDVPSPLNPPPGCRFHTRCPLAADVCREQEPELTDRGSGHLVACHRT
jgi:oligopeptide/dipeptide ABC transporter ATP-binding protein